MLNPLRLVMVCVCALAISSTAYAAGAPFELPTQFKAEMEGQMTGQKMAFTIYAGGDDRQRVEMNAMGMATATIMRKDQKKVYMLMLDAKQVMEMPYDASMAQNMGGFSNEKDATWERQGDETVRDIPCEKWQVTSAKGEKMIYWLKSDHSPVRMQVVKDGSQIDVRSFTAGKQDAALFDPPTGWSSMTMPAGMGGMK